MAGGKRGHLSKADASVYDSIVIAQIISVQPKDNIISIDIQDSSGQREIQIESSFASINSFRRNTPERLSYVVLGFRKTSNTPTIIRFMHPDEYHRVENGEASVEDLSARKNPNQGTIPLRVLNEGEQEDLVALGSRAESYKSNRGLNMLRSGNLLFKLDPDKLEIFAAAPEYKLYGPNFDSKGNTDVIKFGVVSRMVGTSRKKVRPKINDAFAKEFYVNVSSKVFPQTLGVFQLGQCFDNDGNQIKDPVNGKNIRHRLEAFTAAGRVSGAYFDEFGNYVLNLTDQADIGATLNLTGENSSLNFNIGRDFNSDIGKDSSITIGGKSEEKVTQNRIIHIGGNTTINTAGNHLIKAGGALTLKGSVVKIN